MQLLAEKLAASAGVSRETAETFLRAFPDALLASVAQDRLVELDNFGKFYLVAVSDRGSVDVNTGAHIVIPGYDKLTFAVDDTIVDQFNGVQPKVEDNVAESPAETASETPTEIPAEAVSAAPSYTATSEATSTEAPTATSEATPTVTPSAKKAKASTSAAPTTPKKAQKKVKDEAQKAEPVEKPAEPAAEQTVEKPVQPAEPAATSEQTISLASEETKVIVDQPKVEPSINAKVEPSANETETSATEIKYEPVVEQNTAAKVQPESPTVNETAVNEPAESVVARFFKNLPWWGYVTLVAIIFLILLFIVLSVGGNKDGNEAEEQTNPEATEQVEGRTPAETKSKETAEKKASPKVHILKYGESLTTISVQYYGTEDSMGVIWRLNGFKDPNNIPLGTAIKLP